MTDTDNLTSLISRAVVAKMTPEFIEKEVDARVAKLITESVDKALRTYSETGRLIEKAIEDALRVDRLDLPAYGETVKGILKTQIEARVSELVSGQLARDMDELLGLAPKEVKLSAIADYMREQYENGEHYGPVITVIVEEKRHDSTWVYLDDEKHHAPRDWHRCRFSLLIRGDGTIASASVGSNTDELGRKRIGRAVGVEQRLRAYVACSTKIILDEDAVVTSVGDY
ncbi:MAG: hypothetical protein KAY22_25715 [Rhizorhabdus sp.]|uniref:hypothetical protein n=1 Tax=Rhizorhabdus sp. TaxID=1968843 RepID=UPI001B3F7C68|nr:hypothetical protein [Rhizorhabdus sp.]MBP8235697.1 hypothetical protein [Rhizorhabdus sp.]